VKVEVNFVFRGTALAVETRSARQHRPGNVHDGPRRPCPGHGRAVRRIRNR
jgi:hypothetical protein